MNNTIEIDDKKYIVKEVTKEDQVEKVNYLILFLKILIEFAKLILKALRFSLYLALNFLQIFINVLRSLFLNGYEPFGIVKKTGYNILNRIADKNIRKERIRFATEQLTKHTYEFERSDLYSNTYKYIQSHLKDFADNNVSINYDIYKDILQKIDILTVEVEKKALQEGYNYAAFTKYRFSDEEEVYDNFIEYKIMRGEGNGKINKKQ